VLSKLQLFSAGAVELLIGTAYQESRLRYLHQLGGGPARGIFQMEPATHKDIWDNFIRYQPATLKDNINNLKLVNSAMGADEMEGNLYYACAMARIHYYRVKEALPAEGDVAGMARYWKKYYNTPLGAGTEQEYINNWRVVSREL
jgi:hypothetical protein